MTAAKPTENTVRQKRGQDYHIFRVWGGDVPPVPPYGSAPDHCHHLLAHKQTVQHKQILEK